MTYCLISGYTPMGGGPAERAADAGSGRGARVQVRLQEARRDRPARDGQRSSRRLQRRGEVMIRMAGATHQIAGPTTGERRTRRSSESMSHSSLEPLHASAGGTAASPRRRARCVSWAVEIGRGRGPRDPLCYLRPSVPEQLPRPRCTRGSEPRGPASRPGCRLLVLKPAFSAGATLAGGRLGPVVASQPCQPELQERALASSRRQRDRTIERAAGGPTSLMQGTGGTGGQSTTGFRRSRPEGVFVCLCDAGPRRPYPRIRRRLAGGGPPRARRTAAGRRQNKLWRRTVL